VSFVDNKDGTATISGAPAPDSGGAYPLSITAHNGVGSDAVQAFVLTVTQVPTIDTAAAASFSAGTGGSFTIHASGFPSPSLTESDGLPAGLTFVDHRDGTATLGVAPTAAPGSATIHVTASNTAGSTDQSLQLTITSSGRAPVFTAATPPASSVVGGSFSYVYAATGDPAPTFTVTSGALPAGLALDSASGVLAGSPTTAGTFNFVVTASNSAGSVTAPAAITVTATLSAIAVSPATAAVPVGTTKQFSAVGTYSDGTTQDITGAVTWSVPADATVATISASGLALGQVAGGPVTITATLDTVSSTAALTVTPPAVVKIAVTPATASIAKGTTQSFTATGTFTDDTTQDLTGRVVWSSSDSTVALIDTAGGTGNPGRASALTSGSTTITATLNGVSGAATLTVTPAALTSIAVLPSAVSAAPGTTKQFTATGTFTDGTTQELTAPAVWTSSNTTVATVGTAGGVSSPGLASALAVGTAIMSATFAGVSGTATLSVTAVTLKSLSITPAKASIPKGSTQQFSATAAFSDGSSQDVTGVANWSSTDSAIATVSAGGLVHGGDPGKTTISATFTTLTAKATVTATPAIATALQIAPFNVQIAKGLTVPFMATAVMSDGSLKTVTTQTTWSTSSTAVASFKGRIATAVGVGQTSVTATFKGLTSSVTLTVTPATLRTIRVSPTRQPIEKGATLQFRAVGTYTDGTTQDITTSAIWATSSPAVATINAAGTAKGVAKGVTSISATLAEISAKVRLQVK
jgi:hypothetical protein